MRRLRPPAHIPLGLLLLFVVILSVFTLADVCNPYCCPIDPGGGGGGGGPTPTPDPYAWIANLPLYGETPHILGVWKNGDFTVGLWWYGDVRDPATVIDPSDVELRLAAPVFVEMTIQDQAAWAWSGFVMHDDIYSQQSMMAGITMDGVTPCTFPGPPAGYIIPVAGCNGTYPPMDYVGMNAILHEAPMVTFGGSVVPVLNYTLDFAHRLS